MCELCVKEKMKIGKGNRGMERGMDRGRVHIPVLQPGLPDSVGNWVQSGNTVAESCADLKTGRSKVGPFESI